MKEQDTYSFEVVRTASYAYHFFPVHTLVYLYGGRLQLRNQCGESLSVGRGDCAFIGRDSYSYLYAEPVSDASCRMTFFSLSRQFLCEFYQTLDTMQRNIPGEPLSALHLLPCKPETESFFHSLAPYMQNGQEPSEEVLRVKMVEIVCSLLDMDKRYIPTLFDFAGTCRMGLLDLLRKETDTGIVWKNFDTGLFSKYN